MAHCASPSQLVADIPKVSDHLLSHNSLCKWLQQLKLHFCSSPTAFSLLTFDWLVLQVNQMLSISPDIKACEQCFALATCSTLRSLFCTEAGFLYALFLQMSFSRLLHSTVLSNVLSAGTNWCGCPLKIRINVLSLQGDTHRNGDRRKFSMHLTSKECSYCEDLCKDRFNLYV